ncbi:TraB family protein [Archaeoglobales archaeon]|nr:MAG: TraB family protein [Archaeoglobales archaeon]
MGSSGEEQNNQKKEVIIVGTAHVSKKSIEEVEETIEKVRPDVVAVELCNRRYQALIQEKHQDIPIIDVIRRGEAPLLLFQLMLSYFQRKIGEEYGVKPGEEMIAAIKKAEEIGADVLLIDRDIGITFKRFWNSLSILEKLKLVYYLIKSLFIGENEMEIDEMLKEDVLEALVKEFRKISPSAAKILIDERDAYMAFNILSALNTYDKIVAVVGAGHKKGIEKYLKSEKIDIAELTTIKEGRFSIAKLFGYGIFIIVMALFLFILINLSSNALITAFIYWFLINGVLAAIGAFIARGHPLSILAAFLSAWLTSLNPAIAAGWVSGIVEAWIRKPTARDLQEITKANNFNELLNNKFFKVLLVVALTNVGSGIGTFLGIYYVIKVTGIDIAGFLKDLIFNLIR